MKHKTIFLLILSCLLTTITSCQEDDEIFDESMITALTKAASDRNAFPLIAHRGCWNDNDAPENSLAAFKKALELKIYGTEFDIRQTHDGVLVINHDATFGTYNIANTEYKNLDAYRLSNGENIPLYEDFVNTYINTDTKVRMVLDLKICNIDDVLLPLEENELMDRVLFVSFSKIYCDQLVKKGYGNITYYLNGDMTPEEVYEAGYRGIDYSYEDYVEHPQWIDQAQALGLDVGVWTINTRAEMLYYIENGLLVTTDKVEQLLNSYYQ